MNKTKKCAVMNIITHAPLFQGGADYDCESPLGDSSLVMKIHSQFMHLWRHNTYSNRMTS